MNKMLRNYYAKLRIQQRSSLHLLSDLQNKTKIRTKSQSALNNLTKTSEKSSKTQQKPAKTLLVLKPQHPKAVHQSKCSEIPRISLTKSKPKKFKKSKHQSTCEANVSLSDSYDSILNNFQCDSELRKSLKRLVILEKNELKRKFNHSKANSASSVFLNSQHNSKTLNF